MNILYYDGGNIEKRKNVEAVLQGFPVTYMMADAKAGTQTIASLFDMEKKTDTLENVVLPPLDLMIFHEVEDDLIHAISNELKTKNCHVERKCVVTKHNQAWKLKDLLQEIMEEHAYFQVYEECKQEIMAVSSMQENAYTKESWAVYQTAFMQGYMLLQAGQPPLDQLKHVLQEIIKAKESLTKV